MPRGDRQLNIRLSDEQDALLEAAAWVSGSSRLELGREAIGSMLQHFAKDPDVREVLARRGRRNYESGQS